MEFASSAGLDMQMPMEPALGRSSSVPLMTLKLANVPAASAGTLWLRVGCCALWGIFDAFIYTFYIQEIIVLSEIIRVFGISLRIYIEVALLFDE